MKSHQIIISQYALLDFEYLSILDILELSFILEAFLFTINLNIILFFNIFNI